MKKQYLVAGLLISLSFDSTSSKASGRGGDFEHDLQDRTSQTTVASHAASYGDSELYHKYEAYRDNLLRNPHLIFQGRNPSANARDFIEALKDPIFQSTILELRNHDMFKAAYAPVLGSYLQSCSKEERATFLRSIFPHTSKASERAMKSIDLLESKLSPMMQKAVVASKLELSARDGTSIFNLSWKQPYEFRDPRFTLPLQSLDKYSLCALKQVFNGDVLYRIGTAGKSSAAEGRFWALTSPIGRLNTYIYEYGLPAENVAQYDFIALAALKPGSHFITRHAPGVGLNTGGAIEVVVSDGGIILKSFRQYPNSIFFLKDLS